MGVELGYASSQTPEIANSRITALRAMATVFAALAALSPVLAFSYVRLTSGPVTMFAFFAPGLPVAIGLIWRAFGHPPLTCRRVAWALFLVVAGAWELILFANQLHGIPPRRDLYLLICWVIASLLSVLWLVLEPPLPRPIEDRKKS